MLSLHYIESKKVINKDDGGIKYFTSIFNEVFKNKFKIVKYDGLKTCLKLFAYNKDKDYRNSHLFNIEFTSDKILFSTIPSYYIPEDFFLHSFNVDIIDFLFKPYETMIEIDKRMHDFINITIWEIWE